MQLRPRRQPGRALWLLLFLLLLLGGLLLPRTTRPAVAAGEEPLQFPTPEPVVDGSTSLVRYERLPVCAVKQDASREILRLPPTFDVPCENGQAAGFACQNIDLAALLPLADIGGAGAEGNDLWGWTDPVTGQEFALMGLTSGTAFVDVTNPTSPVHLGNLPSHTGSSIWRDIKVYADHAYIVADLNGSHGVQVFDLTQLRSVVSPPVTFSETAHYNGIGSAHNIVINEATGYAYVVGGSSGNTCSGGLHMIDLSTPTAPAFAGCYAGDGYTHDAQCVIYDGPDRDYQGQEVCFGANEDTITLVDVTDKSSPVRISRTGYAGRGYTHQNWLTEDHRYLLLNDELDEQFFGNNTRTFVWDVQDLDNPVLVGTNDSGVPSIDHNLYTLNELVYEANYRSGLRIMDLADVASATLPTVAYFDIYPGSDAPSFNGAWSVYPYFESGTIIVSGIEQGLVVLRARPALSHSGEAETRVCRGTVAEVPVRAGGLWGGGTSVLFDLSGIPAGATATMGTNPVLAPGTSTLFFDAGSAATGPHEVTVGASGGGFTDTLPVAFEIVDPAAAATLLAPADGAEGVSTTPLLEWEAVSGATGYTVEVASDAAFTTIIHAVSGVVGTSYMVPTLESSSEYFWRVQAESLCSGASSATFRFVTTNAPGQCTFGTLPVSLYRTDFDSGSGGWSAGGGLNNSWTLSDANPHSGGSAWFAQALGVVSDQRLTSPQLILPAGATGITLDFWNRQVLESAPDGCFDAGLIEIWSSDNPAWQPITEGLLTDPYDGTIVGGSGNPLAGELGWCGSAQEWINSVVALDAYAGQLVRLRFRLGTNNGVGRLDGWTIDDVSLQYCADPASPLPNPVRFYAPLLIGN